MAKKSKALKSRKKEAAELRKQKDKLAETLAKVRKGQAAAHRELRSLFEERLPIQDADPEEHGEGSRDGDERTEVTEVAQRRAGELGVDLSGVKGTGSGGRILVKDVEAVADGKWW